jgi:hypothetical protein
LNFHNAINNCFGVGIKQVPINFHLIVFKSKKKNSFSTFHYFVHVSFVHVSFLMFWKNEYDYTPPQIEWYGLKVKVLLILWINIYDYCIQLQEDTHNFQGILLGSTIEELTQLTCISANVWKNQINVKNHLINFQHFLPRH